ncbi:aminotransferase class III-fold pyridoxal phosphate-dependent enzyme [Eudoraea adriatica]|uniref:aminotransferase class III-fold pyridoxal phosphate-dependent enzyme n=1 Tax=Eudoraea adriatica TaxID=446681 RepID=UPI0003773119|nr:aminotransferase class III-fold pyridoxal phosphate-dependent enzyme [Eudoraea adriatica]
MKGILKEQFGINAIRVERLSGLDNANYLVETPREKYIFKTYPATENTHSLVEAENNALLFLQNEGQRNIQTPIPSRNQSYTAIITIDGQEYICRMLSYLEGKFLADVPHTKKLFQTFGKFLAQLDLKLQQFTDFRVAARKLKWDIQQLHLIKKYLKNIPNKKDRSLVHYYIKQYEENVTPFLTELRTSVIHNDANELNVLVDREEITGIIDFGDMAQTFLINELAIAITYACYDKDNPLDWAAILIESYHEILPLQEKELEVIYYLIAARLCISVCFSANAREINGDNEYAFVSEKYAWQMLNRWLAINPIAAENCFRKAAGFPAKNSQPVENILKKRYEHMSSILSVSYDTPIYMKKAAFQYMYDAYGNTYLDAYNNIPHVGHCHPKVVDAGQRQMAKLNTNTRYLYDSLNEYAEKLLSKFPDSLNKVYFVNSGSAATDLALRMAAIHAGNEKIMVLEHGYHGNTRAAIDVSYYKFNNPKGSGKKEHILVAPIPDTYRGKYTNDNGSAGKSYGEEAIRLIENSETPIGAFICEPIIGCGGQVPLAKGYLKHLYPAIRNQGGICIDDEVQLGFGRLGNHYWGYEAQEVVPDVVVLGKPMANGHPMGAVVCTSEISASFEKGVEFFSSFGGNPVSCAIALSVMEVIEEENLQENAKLVGDYYKSLLKELQKKYPCIGDVRGSGLYLGVEIIKDNSMDQDTGLAQYIKNELRNRHILISTDGPYDSVLKTKPPLRFSKEDAFKTVEQIDMVLEEYYKNKEV